MDHFQGYVRCKLSHRFPAGVNRSGRRRVADRLSKAYPAPCNGGKGYKKCRYASVPEFHEYHNFFSFWFLTEKTGLSLEGIGLFLIDPAEPRWYKERESLSDDQPSTETGFRPGRRHGSLTGPCAACLFLPFMSFPVTCSKTKKAKNIWTGTFSCPTFLALGSTT